MLWKLSAYKQGSMTVIGIVIRHIVFIKQTVDANNRKYPSLIPSFQFNT